jgi:hypothetical protein
LIACSEKSIPQKSKTALLFVTSPSTWNSITAVSVGWGGGGGGPLITFGQCWLTCHLSTMPCPHSTTSVLVPCHVCQPTSSPHPYPILQTKQGRICLRSGCHKSVLINTYFYDIYLKLKSFVGTLRLMFMCIYCNVTLGLWLSTYPW